MEIERKWMVAGWPQGLDCTEEYRMDQGYFSVRPTVRIRREALQGGDTRYVLCFKGAGTLAREEIETDIAPDLFDRLKALLGKPLIAKVRRGYALPGGLTLEVNRVDAGQPGEFFYAEIEYPHHRRGAGLAAGHAGAARLPGGRGHRPAPAPAWANTGCAPAAKPSDPACRARPTARRGKICRFARCITCAKRVY